MSSVTEAFVVILAAGEGTRMKSARPKVLHEVAGRSLVGHVIAATLAAGPEEIAVVVGPGREDVAAEVRRHAPAAAVAVQHERRGTAHAVLAARAAIEARLARGRVPSLVVLFADTPLIRPETIRRLAEAAAQPGTGVAVLGFRSADPTGYGRLILGPEGLEAIREHKDASPEERRIDLCNGGLMALAGSEALTLLDAIGCENAQKEFYLTDAVALARGRGMAARLVEMDETEAMGVNDRAQLAAAEARMQARLRQQALAGGATLIDPASVFLSTDTVLEPDTIVEPNVVFGPGVRVESGAVIHAFSHLEGARVGPGASIGPFARLRPGADAGARAKIGNFVEVKAAEIGAGAKVSHLSYIGDARVGPDANIGAGTITCNYDGFRKFRTEIGAGAFVGSNTSLVAPVSIGPGAYVGSGSVVTEDVPADALAVARGRQHVKGNWAADFRARPENAAKKR